MKYYQIAFKAKMISNLTLCVSHLLLINELKDDSQKFSHGIGGLFSVAVKINYTLRLFCNLESIVI